MKNTKTRVSGSLSNFLFVFVGCCLSLFVVDCFVYKECGAGRGLSVGGE